GRFLRRRRGFGRSGSGSGGGRRGRGGGRGRPGTPRRFVLELVLAEIALHLGAGQLIRPPGEERLPAIGADVPVPVPVDSSFDAHAGDSSRIRRKMARSPDLFSRSESSMIESPR